MSAAFWCVGNSNRGELDIFEHIGQSWDPTKDKGDIARTMQMSIHNWRPEINERLCSRRHWTQKHTLGFDVTDGMHVYAADWTEDYVTFYVDGSLVRALTKQEVNNAMVDGIGGWVIDEKQRIWIDCEIFDWEGSLSELKPEMFGAEAIFEVDYVRVWKRGNGGHHQTSGHVDVPIANSSFAADLDGWNTEGAVEIQDVSAWKFWKDNNPLIFHEG